jgi:uncharacterized coiled-coil DUF342 family protein
MSRTRAFLTGISLLALLLNFAGCDKKAEAERQKALVEVEKAKAELARLRALLQQTREERDQLKNTLTETLEKLADAKSQINSAKQVQQQSWNQVAELAQQRDTAIGAAEKTFERINEMSQKITDLQNQNRELEELLQQTQADLERCNRLFAEEGNLAPAEQITELDEEGNEPLEQLTEEEQLEESEESIDSEP